MSRFLFVVPPLAGHANPAAGVAHALAGRGHDVAWAGSEKFLRPLAGPAATIYPTGMRLYRPQADRGLAALKFLWDGYLLPLARFTRTAVDQAVQQHRPDVMVVDQHAIAGAMVAHRHGLRWATLAPTLMELAQPYREMPMVAGWVRDRLAAVCAEAGLPPGGFDPLFSPHVVLSGVSAALTAGLPIPRGVVMVGPTLGPRPAAPDFPWPRLDPGRRHVLVTMGTLATGVALDFYARMLQALRPLAGVQPILAGAPPTLTGLPPDALACPQVPVLDLLPHLHAVVCHGGVNTVCEALAHAVPLLIAPVRHDQPIMAAQVSAAGAGLRVHVNRARPDQLTAALAAILDTPSFGSRAQDVQRSFTAAGGGTAAAQHLERLAGHKV